MRPSYPTSAQTPRTAHDRDAQKLEAIMIRHHRPRRAALAAFVALAFLLFGALVPSTAQATPTYDTGTGVVGPPRTSKPEVAGSASLPTAQINGVAWSQVVVGNTVYVGGEFTSARPPGAAAGTSEQARGNLMAFDVRTGALLPWAPKANAQVRSLALSPDGSTLYAGGSFTSIDGQARYRVAAFSTATGALLGFRPVVNTTVLSVSVSQDAVFLGGSFTNVNGLARYKAASVAPGTGLTTLPFNPAIDNRSVQAVEVSPDGAAVVVAGNFTSVGGSSNPGYGLARIDAATGELLSLPANTQIRNAGDESAFLSLSKDDKNFYGTGYHFGDGGNVEGVYAVSWEDGTLQWVEDCHGDSYGVTPFEDAVYVASHKHYCGNSGGFPQTNPSRVNRGSALTKTATGTNIPDIYGYEDTQGQPHPEILDWFPDLNTGSYTGQGQGAWSIAAGSGYVIMGGEFTRVNNTAQQGLARFASRKTTPDTDAPRYGGAQSALRAVSPASGTVVVSWPANFDRGDEELTYRLVRNDTSTVLQERTVTASFWKRPTMSFVDTGLTPGSTTRYRVRATDATGNGVWSEWVTVTVASSGSLSTYARTVAEDGPSSYWRLSETSGTTAADLTGTRAMTTRARVTMGTAGAIAGDSDTAMTFSGSSNGDAIHSTNEPAPVEFSAEAWIKTSTNRGGRIIGFGSATSGTPGTSGTSDRHVYMDNAGRLHFGVQANGRNVVSSRSSYNDNAWHHVVATMSQADGLALYVDGVRVASRDDVRIADAYNGYWRLGGGSLSSWTNVPSSVWFAGAIDDAAVYDGRVLTSQQVRDHFEAAGRMAPVYTAPDDAYGAAVASADPLLFWRFAETSGSAVADSGRLGRSGTLSGSAVRGEDGAIEDLANASIRFTTRAHVFDAQAQANPTRFSTEAWFKTATTQGGRIVGFGNSTGTTSSSYDRHTYMQDDGRLVFGIYRGAEYRVTSTQAYNDGQWHHVVSTLGDAGMRMYVDGVLVGTNPQRLPESYTGYWRVGGDNTWGSTSQTLVGSVDDVAVYGRQLDAETVALHHALGATGEEPNAVPTASFTTDVTDLAVAVDASASADTDGTIEAYAWSFGDGAIGTGRTATHTYAEAGTYTITLTVTDDRGVTAETTHDVTVAAPVPNVAPVAVFSSEVDGLSVEVDASGSSDSDGSVEAYAWDFGDGEDGTGRTASHTFAQAGSYSVRLTVTDDDGATGTVTHEVVVEAPPVTEDLAVDAFGRSVSSGWGSATTGGEWSVTGTASTLSRYSVAGGEGRMSLTPGATRSAFLRSVSATSTEVQTTVSMDRLPAGNSFLTVAGRAVGTSGYVARVRVATDGAVQLHVGRGISSVTALAGGVVDGLMLVPGEKLRVRLQVTGTSPTTVRAKVWRDGDAEPATWRATANDSTADLQVAGGVALQAYVGGAAGSPDVLVAWDDLWAGQP